MSAEPRLPSQPLAHDLLVVTSADPLALAGLVAGVERVAGQGTRVQGVLDARRGNLGGTVDAWAAIRAGITPSTRVAILHDGGQATRSRTFTAGTGGSRGALRLGTASAGRELDLLALVARTTGPWAQDPRYVDVFWGGQLTGADRLGPPGGWLCKLARPIQPADVTAEDAADLGWFAIDGTRVDGFAPRGSQGGPDGIRSWADGRALAADLGSASLHRELLDALIPWCAADPRPRDLDPDLTAPWVRALGGTPADSPADRDLDRLLRDHPALAVPDAVQVRPFAGTWVRVRRPEDVRTTLVARAPHEPAVRALLGLEHPIARAWLGGVWVEGPEVSWASMAAGVTIGGVTARDAVLLDVALRDGSSARSSWIARCSGRLQAAGSVLLDVHGDGAYADEVRVEQRRPRPDAVALLARGAPPASDVARWAGLIGAGHLLLAPGDVGQGTPTRLVAPRGATVGVLEVRPDRWPPTAASEVALLEDGLARHLGDPGGRGTGWRSGRASPVGRAALTDAVHRWDPAQDPLREDLGALLAALDALPDAPIEDLPAFGAAWRIALEHRRWDAHTAWRALRVRVTSDRLAGWLDAGQALQVGPATLPLPERPAPRGDLEAVLADLRPGQVLGLAGPAAAGKTTLADALAERLAAEGRPVMRVHGDVHTWAGPGFRYVQHAAHRDEWIEGPAVYDDRALAASIAEARQEGRIAVVDGVYLGLGARDRFDRLVVLAPDPAVAWARKSQRDGAPGSPRAIDLVSDFARKLFREHRDALPRQAATADVVRP